MKLSRPLQIIVGLALATAPAALITVCTLPQPAAAEPNALPLINAAQLKYGARVTVEAPPNVIKDRQTISQDLIDGNAHSRYVMTGAPYTIRVDLPFRIPIERLSFAHSDYDTEAAPKELEISIDGSAPLRQTLELKRPEKRRIAWQDVPIGRDAKTLVVTVLSNYEGAVKWGGLGEIAIWTSASLDDKFRVPGWDAASPVFVHAPTRIATNDAATHNVAAAVKVLLPPQARPGEHPRLLFTPQELSELRAALPASPRGKEALATLINVADAAAKNAPEFLDPKGPGAQLKDRGDALAKRHDTLSKNAGALGVAYALTGEARYAKAAAAILTGYARLYADYPEHKGANANDTSKVMAQRLSEAMWLIPLIESFDYIFNSDALSADDKTLIETGLLRPAISMIRRQTPADEVAARDGRQKDWRTSTPSPKPGSAVGNWLNFYNAATMMTGAVLNDRDMMDLAAADFRSLMMQGIGEDGLWGEGAIGYQMFALGAMVPGFETAARQGIDLWSFDNARFKQLFDSPLRYAYPDGTMPGINDSSRAKLGDWSTMIYDYAFLRYGDARYSFLVNESPRQLFPTEAVYAPTRLYNRLPEPPTVNAQSTLFGNLGYAILRDDNKYALLDYGPHGGTHGHYDKLNLLLFARGTTGLGDEMGGEPVFRRYEDALHGEWTTQTVAHNTLTVDEQSQAAGEGKLLLFEDTPQVKLMRAESATSYAGAILDRTVLTTPDAVIDLFHGRSSFARNWDRTFRFAGKLAQLPSATSTKPLGTSDGYQHFQVAARQPAKELWRGIWQNAVGPFEVLLAGAPNQQLILGTGPDKDEIALARQSGTRADFAAVYTLPAWKNRVQSARWVAADKETGPSVFEMTQQDGAVSQVIVAHAGGAWEAAGWRSDAKVLWVQKKGAALQLMIGGGSFAQKGTRQFRQNAAGNYLAQQRGAKLEAVSQWTP